RLAHLVTLRAKRRANRLWNAALDEDRALVLANSRRLAGLLRVHAEDEVIEEDLHVALGLHVAAHHAVAEVRRAVLRHEGGNDRVKRALRGLDAIAMLGIEREKRSSILQADSGPGHDEPRAKAVVEAIDERD